MRDFIHENDTEAVLMTVEITNGLKIKTFDICKTCMSKLIDSTCLEY